MIEHRIQKLIDITKALQRGKFSPEDVAYGNDTLAILESAISDLAKFIESKFKELSKLTEITQRINSGIVLEEVLNYTFDSFREIIPYNRIGFSLIENDGVLLKSIWAKSDAPNICLPKGYSARLQGSSLEKIIATGQPRIINDLAQYYKNNPKSDSTRRILDEGMRSSVTFPLVALNKPIGFIFFTSTKIDTYKDVHLDIFSQIAGQFAIIVEKSRLYDKLLNKNIELIKKDQLKDEFLSAVTHELHTPLTIIHESVSQMLDGIMGPILDEQRTLLEISKRNTQRLGRLIGDILDLAKIEAKRIVLNKEPLDLIPIVKEVVDSCSLISKKKNLEIVIHAKPESISLKADRLRMIQIFTNLIDNAIKYSEKGTITVSVNDLGEHIECSVKDEGVGIPQEALCKVFTKFEQFNRKAKAGYQGTGLGLCITKELIELHGGDIWVGSVQGQGTTITFHLPKVDTKDNLQSTILDFFTSASSRNEPFSLLTIQIDDFQRVIHNKSRQELLELMKNLEENISQSLPGPQAKAMRARHTFWVLLPATRREDAFHIGESAHHKINQLLLKECGTNSLKISWHLVSYPENAVNFNDFISQIGPMEETP